MDSNFKLFEAVQMAQAANKPDSRWIKVLLARVAVTILDPLSGLPKDIVVSGDPNTERDSCVINCWTPLETAYFEQANKYHILNGNIVPFKKTIEKPLSPNAVTDEEIREILEKKFIALANFLKKIDSVTTVQRVLLIAEEMNVSVKTAEHIKQRLAELQQKEYTG